MHLPSPTTSSLCPQIDVVILLLSMRDVVKPLLIRGCDHACNVTVAGSPTLMSRSAADIQQQRQQMYPC